MSDFLKEIISKCEKKAEEARTILADESQMAAKIKEGLARFDSELEETQAILTIHEGSLVGTYVEGFVSQGKHEIEAQIGTLGAVIDSLQRFLTKAPEIRREFERLLDECRQKISGAEIVLKQLAVLRSYQGQKDRLRETYSDKAFFELNDLVDEIEGFETEFYQKDFIPFFIELKGRNNSESRVLTIPSPDVEEAQAVEKFRANFKYELIRADLLSRPWCWDNVERSHNLVSEMRFLAHQNERYGPLVKDFANVFLPQLQSQNKKSHILELR